MVEDTRQLETQDIEPTEDVNFGRHIGIAIAIVVLSGILTILMESM